MVLFADLIYVVCNFYLLKGINKQVLNCLLQIHIPEETTKPETELLDLLKSEELEKLKNMQILGLIGMATNTSDTDQV